MADGQARGATREAPVGQKRAGFAQTFGFQIAGGIEHFLHARPALWPFIADDDDITLFDLVRQDRLNRGVLAFEHPRGAGEFQDRFIHASGFHDAAIGGDVALQNSQTAILGKRVFGRADDALFAVKVQFGVALILAKRGGRADVARRGLEEIMHLVFFGAADVPTIQRVFHRGGVHGKAIAVDQARVVELAQDRHDATGAVDVFHVHVLLGRRDLGQAGHPARHSVDVVHGEINPALMGGGQNVQHGVGGPAHGDVQRHGVFKRLLVGDIARQDRVVVLFVIALGDVDDQVTRFDEQPLAVTVGGKG